MIIRGTSRPLEIGKPLPNITAADLPSPVPISEPAVQPIVEELQNPVAAPHINPIDESTPLEKPKAQEAPALKNIRYRMGPIDVMNENDTVTISKGDASQIATDVHGGGLMFTIKVDGQSYGVFISRVGILSEDEEKVVELEPHEAATPKTEG